MSNKTLTEHKCHIQALRAYDPFMAASEISRRLDLSRERVRQILNVLHMDTTIARQYLRCKVCGQNIPGKGKIYCSMNCWHIDHSVEVKCEVCGKVFRKRNAEINRALNGPEYSHPLKHFCSHKCFGAYAGVHYGFPVHGKHGPPRSRKWNYEAVIKRVQEIGFTKTRKELNIPSGTLSNIYYVRRKELTNVQ